MSVKRVRMAPVARRQQIVAAARDMLREARHLPLKLEVLAQRAGISKGLIYAYFPTQQDLFNSVLEDEFDLLDAAGLEQASLRPELMAAAGECADIYCRHIAEHGPTLHVVLRDPLMSRSLTPDNAARRDRVMRRIARRARRELRMTAKEAVASLNMLLTVPEEAGRLVYDRDVELATGLALCANLLPSSIKALRPT